MGKKIYLLSLMIFISYMSMLIGEGVGARSLADAYNLSYKPFTGTLVLNVALLTVALILLHWEIVRISAPKMSQYKLRDMIMGEKSLMIFISFSISILSMLIGQEFGAMAVADAYNLSYQPFTVLLVFNVALLTYALIFLDSKINENKESEK